MEESCAHQHGHHCRQSSCRSSVTPSHAAILIASHSLKSSLSSPRALRSAAGRAERRSSEEHLQFKRDAYATALCRLKVSTLLRHPALPCRVSAVLCCNSILPARLCALLQGWRSASRPEHPWHRAGTASLLLSFFPSFPRLLVAKPRERVTATAALPAPS